MAEGIQENQSTDLRSPIPGFDLEDGRDELNLAEFPLAAIADRVPDNQKTLVFEDSIYDSGKAETITRRLTISASDKYGLPTSLDDEVILGLIQLTKQTRFNDRKVNFSRYQLIQILGWRHEGRSYERLEKSLKRWLGVTLYYDKAWWDKDTQSWVDENFHILDHVTLYNQERRLKKMKLSQSELPLSSFTWNDVVFRSFKAGYLKSIDLRLYRQLEFAAAKRMYRFLDKRFYHRPRWEFDLVEFSCEHIGLSRNYDTAQLKRRLQPSIEELEKVGFLEPLPVANRYVKISRGQWRVVFVQKSKPVPDALPDGKAKELQQKMVEIGVTPSVVVEILRDYPLELVETQLEVLVRLLRTKEREAIRNPAGYLVKSIREGYVSAKPPSLKPAATKSAATPAVQAEPAIDPLQKAIDDYLDERSPDELLALEALALQAADSVLVDGYYRSKKAGGALHGVCRRMLLERETRRLLTQAEELRKSA